jgi:DNA gyrase subunit A
MTRKRGKGGGGAQLDLSALSFDDASLSEETRRRYLNYALSVITSRALPDVRDGLKPVQRRILYTMWNELRLRSDAKYRKSAAIVGDVMGKFHPHGDTAIYDALVRLAQDFTMRAPLVDGRGNFGSPDGDSAAAMRYTEAKLKPVADELLNELGKRTVAFRPNYDGTRFEPVVLPSRFPNLLVNGSQGIAVGMATSIPPHNMGEIIRAAMKMVDEPDISVRQLMRGIKGPDFPTGGEIVTPREEIVRVYEEGQGSFKLRGTWKVEEQERGNTLLVIDSIPYATERCQVVEKVAEVIIKKKLPVLLDVRDESTDECRIVCEIKKGTDPHLVMTYLYKHTPLQTSVAVNLTCLVPTDHPEVTAPQRLDLRQMIRHFLDFRMEVVTKRLEHDLQKLEERIHILEGFATIYDALDETIRIIRRSDDKADAAQKLMKRFGLDDEQVDAILELKLYRLAKLQILLIQKELEEKQKEAKGIRKLLGSEPARWTLIKSELHELEGTYGLPRSTHVRTELDEPQYDAEAFIIDEDAMVVLSEHGWVKRQQSIRDLEKVRIREGDAVLSVVGGSTRHPVAFFSNQGACYVTRIADVPPSTGHGSPIQTLFKLADGERIVAMLSFDPRVLEVPAPGEEPEPPFALAVTKLGQTLRFSLRPHREPSTKSGRRYARLGDGDEVIFVGETREGDHVASVSQSGHALICDAEEVNVLGGAGKGVMLMKLGKGDALVGARILRDHNDALVALNENGTEYRVSLRKYDAHARGGKGQPMFRRGRIERAERPDITVPDLTTEG